MCKTIGLGIVFVFLCWILFEVVSAKDEAELWPDGIEDDEQTKE